MKNFFLLLHTLIFFSFISVSCGNKKLVQSDCHVTVKSGYNGYVGTIQSLSGESLDTLVFSEGLANVVCKDSASMPYVAYVRLVNPDDSTDVLDMPFVVEGGNVNVEVFDYILTTGTPLNVKLQDFLNDLQSVSDGMKTKEDITLADVRNVYSSFYCSQILANKSNVVGQFIYEKYGMNMNEQDKQTVEAAMKN